MKLLGLEEGMYDSLASTEQLVVALCTPQRRDKSWMSPSPAPVVAMKLIAIFGTRSGIFTREEIGVVRTNTSPSPLLVSLSVESPFPSHSKN